VANEGIVTQRLDARKAATTVDRVVAIFKKKNIISTG
jgi:hypothetical protein